MIKYLMIVLVLSNSVYAQDAKFLKKSEAAPFDGYLITPEKAEKVRELYIDNDTQVKVNEMLNTELKLYKERVENYKQHSQNLSEQLMKQQDSSIFTKTGYFILGAVITGVIAYGTTQAIR